MRNEYLSGYTDFSTASNKIGKKLINCILIAVMCFGISLLFSSCDNSKISNNIQETEKSIKKEEPIDITISCVGDIMAHEPQLRAQHIDGKYDFNNNYIFIKKHIEKSDLAICNLETTLAGEPYRGYPTFSSPDELAEAIKNAGFDVAITANNHMMDSGSKGIERTLCVLRQNNIKTAGSKQKNEENANLIVDVKGIKISIIPYTYETTGAGSKNISINGINVPEESKKLINSFSFSNIDEDFNKIKIDCENAKKNGADIIIVYYHWGDEYKTVANNLQRELARKTVEQTDVDVIFASHPHVVQNFEMIQYNNKSIPVFYSMGNFISNQRYETLGNKYTEAGIIANVTFRYDKNKNTILLTNYSALPTWVSRYRDGRWIYEIIPLDEEVENNQTLIKTNKINRALEAKEEVNEILGMDRK